MTGVQTCALPIWGHMDLAGNLAEWMMDAVGPYVVPCVNCATLSVDPGARVVRGGAFFDPPSAVLSSARVVNTPPATRRAHVGARCARSP